jgi:signal transduction histidine kinase
MRSFFFVVRAGIAWMFVLVMFMAFWTGFLGFRLGPLMAFVIFGVVGTAVFRAFSHVHRVHLITDKRTADTLGNRHRRQIEIPFPPEQAFALVDAAIRELPRAESVESTPGSLQVFARVRRKAPYTQGKLKEVATLGESLGRSKGVRDQVRAIIAPGQGTASLTLICEPEGGAWIDWFVVDYGVNLENIEAVSRSITRRVAELRKGEEDQARLSATEKELTVAKLSLLHAQVEPHFLYNTLASAQLLARSDPPRADQLLGHLIAYLRNSVPSAENSMSTLSVELERARAYLEILKIRMGDRLNLQVLVPDTLRSVPIPPMMLQTLVENAIKHGLEPVTGGGTIWIIAREQESKVSVTVADDGRGFSEQGGGTGIGLKNIRERLRLAYGDAASFAVVANFPRGVAATITLPLAGPAPTHA